MEVRYKVQWSINKTMWYPNICKKLGNVIFKYHASPETMDAFFIISLFVERATLMD